MARTSLKIKTADGLEEKLSIMTSEAENKIVLVNIYRTDDAYNPVGTASVSVARYDSEEAYHKDLRKLAGEKGQFVPDYSTNPEWNPGYVEHKDDDHEFQGDLHQ